MGTQEVCSLCSATLSLVDTPVSSSGSMVCSQCALSVRPCPTPIVNYSVPLLHPDGAFASINLIPEVAVPQIPFLTDDSLSSSLAGEVAIDALSSHETPPGDDNKRKRQKRAATSASPVKSSGFKGVSWDRRKQKWMAQISVDSKKAFLGYGCNEEDAARKYDERASQLNRPLNFPPKGEGQAVKGAIGGASRFKGVARERNHKWRASIRINGKSKFLGSFDAEIKAAQKYDECAARLGRVTNFPVAVTAEIGTSDEQITEPQPQPQLTPPGLLQPALHEAVTLV